MKYKIFFIFSLILLILPATSFSIEPAPRISDREIIEKLAILEAGQAALDQRITDLRSEMKTGQAALGKRLDDMNATMLTLFAAIFTLIVALFAYIAWDRRTMLKPVVERLESLEKDLLRDLDLHHKDGSRITSLIQALRELARHDEKLAAVLRNFSLL